VAGYVESIEEYDQISHVGSNFFNHIGVYTPI
jgi:hypothetical protein